MKNDGGPAFPAKAYAFPAHLREQVMELGFGQGMSLRDYFAAQALTGYMLAFDNHMIRSHTDYEIEMNFMNAAAVAYRMADQMLAERSKP